MINKKPTTFLLTKYLPRRYHTQNLLTESQLALSVKMTHLTVSSVLNIIFVQYYKGMISRITQIGQRSKHKNYQNIQQLAVARANEEAKLHYTSLVTDALHEGTIATKQGQRDRQATGRRAPRAPPGLEGVGARQEGEAQGNAGSDGLGVTIDN
ncbi:Hypothetical_protein [Hexamita inflata]|uniref:Hypothetical_protein n=1 Tax=Hexamita inflata TaxID=28002 RepID=A0AA86R1V2_9EUKA|nr:Hypothetical protein HINF_LOCUS56390 [Hexamita inflata]